MSETPITDEVEAIAAQWNDETGEGPAEAAFAGDVIEYLPQWPRLKQVERDLAASQARVARLEEALRNSAKAIEFAEYLAKDAEQLQKAADSLMEHFVECDEPTQAERENYSEHYRGVRGSIYEFRKRAARAALGETGGER